MLIDWAVQTVQQPVNTAVVLVSVTQPNQQYCGLHSQFPVKQAFQAVGPQNACCAVLFC